MAAGAMKSQQRAMEVADGDGISEEFKCYCCCCLEKMPADNASLMRLPKNTEMGYARVDVFDLGIPLIRALDGNPSNLWRSPSN